MAKEKLIKTLMLILTIVLILTILFIGYTASQSLSTLDVDIASYDGKQFASAELDTVMRFNVDEVIVSDVDGVHYYDIVKSDKDTFILESADKQVQYVFKFIDSNSVFFEKGRQYLYLVQGEVMYASKRF